MHNSTLNTTTKLTNAFGKVYLTIHADAVNNWLHAIWEGYLSDATIKTGGQAILDAIKATGYSCALIDMLSVVGPIRTSGWTTDVWTPEMAKAGVQYMALVNLPDAIASTDVINFHSQQKYFESEVFTSTRQAGEWLRLRCRKSRIYLEQA